MSGSVSNGTNRSARTTERELRTHALPFHGFRKPQCPTESRCPRSSVNGKRYFETGPLRASFVRPDKVTVGDFPELDPFADDDDDLDEEMEM